MATLALALCLAVFVVARAFEGRWPVLAYVAAFAEAAAIGGLADWYAVVALFKRPLGLPIPHTAIIPSNQERIADNLGSFIEKNFLAEGPVREKLEQVDFALLVSEWLSERSRAEGLSAFVSRLVPQALTAIEGSGLRDFVSGHVSDQLEKVKVAPLAAELLEAFTEDRRHQRLFDEMVKVFARFLADEEALGVIREKIRRELPSLARLFRADAYLLNKIVSSAGSLMDEVSADKDHPLRAEFDRFVHGFVDKLRNSRAYAARTEKLKRDFLARPELRSLGEELWRGFRVFLEQDANSDSSMIRSHLAGLLVDIGRQLSTDPGIRADMNQGFVVALAAFVESQKSAVSAFIAEQVKSWDLGQLTRLIELNVGRDLQYIRFNGMLIGGIAGLALHVGERFIFGN